jgi:hypothetical protein
MIKIANEKSAAKRLWAKPVLNRLGTIKDVAGPAGSAAQSPVQNRS